MGVSVTQRINQITQPRGGYINPKDLSIIEFNSDRELGEENITPALVGLAVDYLTRYKCSNNASEAFFISYIGAECIKEERKAHELINNIKGLDNNSIISACKLVGYDVIYRAGIFGFKPVDEIKPDESTILNIREMVERTLRFFEKYGKPTLDGFVLDGAFTNIINAGDGDYLLSDTILDLKVSKNNPTNKHTLQLLIYYLMGKRSDDAKFFKDIQYLGIFNPRLNKYYRYDIEKVSKEYIVDIEKNVIGY